MQLFKRMLLSLFPEEMVNNPMNPASMFVGFISAKQYFSVITRKIVENYKLNLFDISLDPFEVKIGFGDSPTIKVKDVDFYYGYASASNLNGYRSYAPSQVAHAVALVASTYYQDISEEYEDYYTLQLVYTVYLLTFLFQARMKQFPGDSKQKDFSWFVELFFSLYEFLLQQAAHPYKKELIDEIKQKLLKQHLPLFFMLEYFYRYCLQSTETINITNQQFFGWLFYDELRAGALQAVAQDFLNHCETSVHEPSLSVTEKSLIHLIFPADILVRYILEGDNIAAIIRHLISRLFPMDDIQEYMTGFLSSDKQFFSFLELITDYVHLKNSYFAAIKKYMTYIFQKKNIHEDEEDAVAIDEWMSSIGEGKSIDMNNIPTRLKQESEMMEKLMNFYITYIGGYWIGRGDSRYVRTKYPKLLQELHNQMLQHQSKQDSLHYFSGLLYSYSKNIFYYKYAFDNIRAGKDKFHLPFRATFREVYSNACITKLFESNFITTLLQDILKKDMKVYVKNKKVIETFGEHFQKPISQIVRQPQKHIISSVYTIYDEFFASMKITESLQQYTGKEIIPAIKDTLYSIEYQIYRGFLEKLQPYAHFLQKKYADAGMAGILSLLRETLFGFCLYVSFLEHKKAKKDNVYTDVLMKFYIVDVLNVSDEYIPLFSHAINHIIQTYQDFFVLLHEIDDNEQYLAIAKENWMQYCYNQNPENIFAGFSGEDIIWFRGFLKTVTYNNKKFIIPG